DPQWPARLQQLIDTITHPDLNDSLNLTAPVTIDSLLDTLTALYHDCKAWCDANEEVIQKVTSLRLNKDDFEIIKPLAKGQFGTVSIVRSKIDGVVYAMKILEKENLLKQKEVGYALLYSPHNIQLGNYPSQQAFFMEERNVLSSAHNSHWIPALHAAFQDAECLYLVMEYAAGGDLYSIQDRREGLVLEEQAARFYIAETVLAVQALHEMQYVHRDIKPQNILISSTGHIKLADFGSCIRLNANKTVTSPIPVGTCDYISPEVLRAGEGDVSYGVEVDWWSVGILLYELLQGEPPFASDSLAETYGKIMEAEVLAAHFIHLCNHRFAIVFQKHLQFNPDIPVSSEAKDLIRRFLCPKEQRLGKNGIKEIREHAFFRGIDWDRIEQVMPPFLPVIRSPDDTSNFSIHDEEDGAPVFSNNSRRLSASSRRDFEGNNLPFIGFTFLQNISGAQTNPSTKNATSSTSSAHLTAALNDALCRLADQERLASQLEKDKSRLQSDLDQLRKPASVTQPSSPTFSGGVARRALEFSDLGLKNQLADAQRRIDDLERDRRRVQSELDAVKKFRSPASEPADDAEKRRLRAELEGERWERDTLERKYGELLAEVEVERGRREHLERAMAEIQKGEGTTRGSQRSVIWLQKELEKVKGELKMAEERSMRNEGTGAAASAAEDIGKEREEARKKVEDEVAKRVEAEKRVEELEKMIESGAAQRKEDEEGARRRLEEDIAELKAESEKLRVELSATLDRQQDFESQVTNLTTQLRAESQLRQTSDSRAYDLLAKLTHLQSATTEAETARQKGDRRLSEQLQPYKSQIDELQNQLSLERLENAQLKIEAEHARKEVERRREEFDRLTSRTDELVRLNERMQAQIDAAAAAEPSLPALDAGAGDRSISLSIFKRERAGSRRLQQQLEVVERKWMQSEKEVERLRKEEGLHQSGTHRSGEGSVAGEERDGMRGSLAMSISAGKRGSGMANTALSRSPGMEVDSFGGESFPGDDDDLQGSLRVSWAIPNRSVKQNFRTMSVKVIDFRIFVFEDNIVLDPNAGIEVADLRADVFAVRTVSKNELVHMPTRDLECMFQVRSSNMDNLVHPLASSSSRSATHGTRIKNLERDIAYEEELRAAAGKMMDQWKDQKQHQDHHDVARQQYETSGERIRRMALEIETLKTGNAEPSTPLVRKDTTSSTKTHTSSSSNAMTSSATPSTASEDYTPEQQDRIQQIERQIEFEMRYLDGARRNQAAATSLLGTLISNPKQKMWRKEVDHTIQQAMLRVEGLKSELEKVKTVSMELRSSR
ncbi:hypothetical protein BC936DRAFT_146901, partial [Jimgerdemannia flammicorona]